MSGADFTTPSPSAGLGVAWNDQDMQVLIKYEQEILTFEREWWRCATAKDQAARDRFGLDAHDYYRTLSDLIDRDEAITHDPLLVRRLRRLRATRRRERAARRTS